MKMPVNLLAYRFWLVFGLATVLVSSCKKTEEATPKGIYDIVLEDTQFSILKAAITQAGLTDFVKSANITLFAPNDAAFQASGYGTAAAVTALPVATLKSILYYHILNGEVKSDDPNILTTGGATAVQTANATTAYLYKNGNTLYVNGARITQADRVAANGIVHVINRLLIPPTGSIVAIGQANSTLSLLIAAATRAASVNPALIAALTGAVSGTQLTIFAPTNAAFVAAGYKDVAAINAANPQTLANILAYHGVSGVAFSPQLQANTTLTTLASGSNKITIGTGTGGTITVKGNTNTSPAIIQQADILATNGVIHIIDQVLKQ